LFHAARAAIAKTVTLRPRLNCFVAGHRVYERKALSVSFVVKKRFEDNSYEALAIVDIDRQGQPPVDQIHDKVEKFVTSVRKHDKTDGTTDAMETLTKMPRFLLRIVVGILMWLDYHGWVPTWLTKDDPYNSSVFLRNTQQHTEDNARIFCFASLSDRCAVVPLLFAFCGCGVEDGRKGKGFSCNFLHGQNIQLHRSC